MINCDVIGQIGYLWLDRPDKSNAMGKQFFAELPNAIDQLEAAKDVRAVVIASTSNHFSTGLDLVEMNDSLFQGNKETSQNNGAALVKTISDLQEALNAVATCKRPVIAAISGYCLGGALDLVACADIRLCSADARFSIREVKLAIVADLGSLQRLPAIIGRGNLAEMALTGRDISAARAEAIGLVNGIYSNKEELLAGAEALAAEISTNSPRAITGIKQSLNNFYDKNIDKELNLVAEINALLLDSGDVKEAVKAFLEKRQPVFYDD